MAYNQRIGRWGEQAAQEFLVEKGLIPLAANCRTAYGEIDLIMRDQETIVFVEVKTRTNSRFGWPEESITPRKQAHLQQTAAFLMQEHADWGEQWRIDVVAINGRPGEAAKEILWFENVVG